MNIFGYGSLMWDGWQAKHGCLSVRPGVLREYQRAFNKASVQNWGSKEIPGPTLNVVSSPGATCEGLVFEFPDANVAEVMRVLAKREGGFQFPEHPIRLGSGELVQARVPVYSGKNLITGKSAEEIATMVAAAAGTSGRCRDYVLNLVGELRRMGISDLVVEDTACRVEARTI